MGLWSVSMLVATGLLWVLRVPSTVVAPQTLVLKNKPSRALRHLTLALPCAGPYFSARLRGFSRESPQPGKRPLGTSRAPCSVATGRQMRGDHTVLDYASRRTLIPSRISQAFANAHAIASISDKLAALSLFELYQQFKFA
jgi:hypothetical protein